MWLKRISAGLIVAAIGVVSVATLAAAEETFEDGVYTLMLPGVGGFEFEIDSVDPVGDETVIVRSMPDGYDIDDDDPDKVAWKDMLTLEVEAKSDKVEGDYDWAGGPAILMLPGGGSITVSVPDGDGFEVTTTGDWWAFGSGSDWFVANNEDIALATLFFKVEADDDGIEIKPTDGPDDGFLNDLDDEDDEDEDEDEDEEIEELELEEEDDGEDDGENNGRGRGKPDSDS